LISTQRGDAAIELKAEYLFRPVRLAIGQSLARANNRNQI